MDVLLEIPGFCWSARWSRPVWFCRSWAQSL